MNSFHVPRLAIPERQISRRALLRCGTASVGWAALANLIGSAQNVQAEPETTDNSQKSRFSSGTRHAKRMVLLFQHGGPSQIDLFDPKPVLNEYAGKPMPGGVEAFFDKNDSGKCLPSPFKFARHGQSGMEFSELLPHLAGCADDLCMIRSLHTVVNDHEGALRHFQTGKPRIGRPSIGSWLTYAQSTPNPKLPPYVVLSDPTHDQVDGIRNWSSGFLPAIYQGTPLRADGPALFDLDLPTGTTREMQREQLELLEFLNRDHQQKFKNLSELDARIANNALAGGIRDEITNALDLSRETPETQKLYGMGNEATGTYSRRCLMARRLLEHGVPFVAVFNDAIMGDPWDTHSAHNERIRKVSKNVDQPSAALIHDLKRTGLLKDTIVLWIGEFGRLPVAEGKDGRDHNRHAFTALAAGGGFKAGYVHGATDQFGYKVTEKPVAVGELHATLLSQFGLDHTALTYPHQGRNESLTDADITGVEPVADLVS
ncbi:MAG: hypothetical protein JWM11_2205 [Planctomycetaceae bacterium]|nr:hypothetical protein [Planctomycetaceae bacterium]